MRKRERERKRGWERRQLELTVQFTSIKFDPSCDKQAFKRRTPNKTLMLCL